jgi:hypothetical protein
MAILIDVEAITLTQICNDIHNLSFLPRYFRVACLFGRIDNMLTSKHLELSLSDYSPLNC